MHRGPTKQKPATFDAVGFSSWGGWRNQASCSPSLASVGKDARLVHLYLSTQHAIDIV